VGNPQVKVDILADATNFQKGTGKAQQSAGSLQTALAKLGPVGNALNGILDKLGLGGISAGAGIAGGVTAAIGVSIGLVEKAIGRYIALADSIRSYAQVTGQSAEEASRQVEAFQELGVSEDLAQTSMFKLDKVADETPAKLEKLGIAVAKGANGNIDLNATLINVMTAYQGTTDAGQRATIMFTAFGKGGQAMIPVLETNVAELEKLEAQVGKVYTQKDLDAARQYSITQKQLGQNWNDLWNTLAGDVVPAFNSLIQNTLADQYAHKKLNEAYDEGKISLDQLNDPSEKLLDTYRKDYIASQNAEAGIAALSQAQQEAANSAKAEADAEDQLYDAIHKSTDANFAYEQAQIDLKNAQDAVKKGTGDATENNLRLREAYVKVADAAVAQAEANAEASGSTLTASQKADIYRSTLENLAAQLGPNDPLRKRLQEYINELNSIPSSKNTTIGYTTARSVSTQGSGHSGTLSFDEGGIVPGPTGSAQPATVHGGEAVFTPEQLQALSKGSGDMSRVEALLEQIVEVLSVAPGGQTGVAAALHKANQLAGLNRSRGMSGA
jgi:hypothetical protein